MKNCIRDTERGQISVLVTCLAANFASLGRSSVRSYFPTCGVTIPRVKERVSERVLRRAMAYTPIRDSGEMLREREKSRPESRRESRWDSWWDSRQDCWRDFSRSPSVSLESRIGLYASARLSPRLIFYAGLYVLFSFEKNSWIIYFLVTIKAHGNASSRVSSSHTQTFPYLHDSIASR